jgi:hypothetical protein
MTLLKIAFLSSKINDKKKDKQVSLLKIDTYPPKINYKKKISRCH